MSTSFLDGPAAGRTFELARAPHFIRVVIAADGPPEKRLDVLDLVEDEPRAGEQVFVYQRVPGTFGVIFACVRGRGGGGGRIASADYRYRADVDGEQFRENPAWQAWCEAQPIEAEAPAP